MWPYRSDEVMVLQSVGAPTAARDVKVLNVDTTTGALSLNQGAGSTTYTPLTSTNIETLTAARVLVAADAGKLFFLNLAGGFDVTLPALTVAGFHCRFIVKTAPTTAYTITGATADKMAGSVFSSSGGAEDTEGAATGDVLNFVANVALIGDQADVVTDGAAYYVRGFCSAAGGITITG